MKVLVTGANGMLGSDLMTVLADRFEVQGCSWEDFDIVDLDKYIKAVRAYKPDIIIHAAAYTDVDGCESNVDLAYQVNALGGRNAAVAAQEIGARLVYISTDYVYDGTKETPYIEYDQTNPLSVYGKSKLEGENYVKMLSDKFFIIRTSWLFGKNGKNFVSTMLDLSKTRKELSIVNDQIGSPTYTPDLAEGIIKLISTDCYGIYHITNSDWCSWYEFAKQIFKQAGISDVILKPITTEELGRPAPRPRNSRLDKYCLRLNGLTELRSYKKALNEYIKRFK